jgi:hypothetical protein
VTVHLRDLFPNMYVQLGPKFRQLKVAGQICINPVLYCYENAQIWRPLQVDSTETQATRFEIVAAGQDAYNRALPLKIPSLSIKEEFPVVKAKRRPVIVLRLADSDHDDSGGIGSASRPLPMVMPLYASKMRLEDKSIPVIFLPGFRGWSFPGICSFQRMELPCRKTLYCYFPG